MYNDIMKLITLAHALILQGYKGIGQWPINQCTSTLMKNYQIIPSVDLI